jgi:serine/threonine protein kinase
MIVTELLEGDLESILRNPNYPISLFDRMKMARDAAQGIAWLHGSNPVIIHRDLKSSNLLFDKNKRIKVCDFGFSQLFQRGKKMVDKKARKELHCIWRLK